MGIEEGYEVQTKGIRKVQNKIIAETFPNLEKDIQEASRTGNIIKIEPLHGIL
jgi:hypothetical protein